MDLRDFRIRAANERTKNRRFYSEIKKRPPAALDELFGEEHDKEFATRDCLQCANCCKTTSPIFYNRDIERASKALRIKQGEFVKRFLRVDEDEDYVLQSSPCPFLDPENRCRVYDHRPDACREYPHTNRKNMQKFTDLTFKNTMVCPAVLSITERVQERLMRQGVL